MLSLDPKIGDHARADVLVEEARIVAVGMNLTVQNAEVIDVAGMIVMPGPRPMRTNMLGSAYCGDDAERRRNRRSYMAAIPQTLGTFLHGRKLPASQDAADGAIVLRCRRHYFVGRVPQHAQSGT